MKYQAKIQKTIIRQGGKLKGQAKNVLTIWLIDAESLNEAERKASEFTELNPTFGQVKCVEETKLKKEVKLIADAENLLFELNASNADEITVSGGIGNKSETHARKDVEASVYAEISEVTHTFNFAAGIHTRRVIS